MKKYDYWREMIDEIKDWILVNGIITHAQKEEWDKKQFADWLHDELWDHDIITGNGAYGYAPEEACEEYIGTNLGLYFEAANELCDFPNSGTPWIYKNPAQHMDATIRCYLLGECIWKALDELNYEVKNKI